MSAYIIHMVDQAGNWTPDLYSVNKAVPIEPLTCTVLIKLYQLN